MTYEKRTNGRGFDQIRPASAKVGIIPNAIGSAVFTIGETTAYAAVYGPKDLFPKFQQNPKTAKLRCHYNMLPFSGAGDRVRPGPNRRSKEISMVTDHSLIPVLDLTDFPNAVVDVFIELSQTDAGSRCAGITAASMALADAGFIMKDLVCAVALGKVGDKIVVDLDKYEEDYDGGHVADVPIAVIPSTGEFSLIQMDGIITRDDLKEILEMSKAAVQQLHDLQKKALKDKYNDESGDKK
ncbi:exosome complex exonuclease Rrp41 [Nanoarchaeota archaeon]